MPRKEGCRKRSSKGGNKIDDKLPVWVYIMIPGGKVYKLATEKIIEHYNRITPKEDKQFTVLDCNTLLLYHLHNFMTWHDIKDHIQQAIQYYPPTDDELLRMAVVTVDPKKAGVSNE